MTEGSASMMNPPVSISEGTLLAPYTTLGLGGPARYFAECQSHEALRYALTYAYERNIRVHILGAGSNSIFADSGFNGLVIRIALRGMSFAQEIGHTTVTVAAGEVWDNLVSVCVDKGLAGVECLAGIPGLVGATPVQNVGAYGQEVADTFVSLRALDRRTLEPKTFDRRECLFGYRKSRFKGVDRDHYVITEVSYRLNRDGQPAIRYPELQKFIDTNLALSSLEPGSHALNAVRSAVIDLRKKKSMVLDPGDPNTKSVGSFFMNPVLAVPAFEELSRRWSASGGTDQIPKYAAEKGVKIPAAWLVEKSGFRRGHKRGGVGISTNHSLALINRGGTAGELVAFAEEIRSRVAEVFGITLELEPEVVR